MFNVYVYIYYTVRGTQYAKRGVRSSYRRVAIFTFPPSLNANLTSSARISRFFFSGFTISAVFVRFPRNFSRRLVLHRRILSRRRLQLRRRARRRHIQPSTPSPTPSSRASTGQWRVVLAAGIVRDRRRPSFTRLAQVQQRRHHLEPGQLLVSTDISCSFGGQLRFDARFLYAKRPPLD